MAEVEHPPRPSEELTSESPKLEKSQISEIETTKEASMNNADETKAEASDKAIEHHVSSPVEDEDRQKNESARLKEAKKWNNRSRHQDDEGGNGSRVRGHGRYNNDRHQKHGKYKHKNKFDPTALPDSDDHNAIRKQVEFYFSDSNLLTDKFLFTKIEGHKNLPVPIDTIHSFKRMQRFQPRSAIVNALRESKTVQLVNEDKDIQRKEALSERLEGKEIDEIQKVHEDESMARTIYAKGFGKEEASTQFDIEAFFANHGTTNSVRLRRFTNGGFKGSVFVEFDSEETAKSFAASDPPPSYRGSKLTIKTKKEYCDDKVEEIKAGRVRPNSPDGRFRGGSSKFGGSRKHENDDRDWRQRRHEDARDGFPNRKDKDGSGRGHGRHRGFGRGGRGGHGGPRDRNEERKAQNEQSASAENKDIEANSATDKGDEIDKTRTELTADAEASTSLQNGLAEVLPKGTTPHDDISKKRSREDDEGTEDTRETKKVNANGSP